ncbi:hypothetical protein DH2020_031116 [Rehmannia glutinosa]|uniref:SGS domain-containing protein n=1 Tax=Rehmannia glutinosa TaxID=99300 RepID=A0ABR0VIT9_REHGL
MASMRHAFRRYSVPSLINPKSLESSNSSMASSDLERKAKEAFIDDHFELAVDLYTQAIALSPTNAELFADRAQANIKLRNFTDAVADANKAIELDPAMAKAYLRKGLETGAALAPGDSRFSNLIKECDERIAEEAAERPKQLVDKAPTDVVTPNNLPSVGLTGQGTSTTLSSTKPKYRHEFYQKPEEVVLSVTIELSGEEAYHFQPRLFGKIIPAKCRYDVMSTKIEIRLAKADAIHWTSLEFSKDVAEKEEKLDGDAALNKFFSDIYRDADEDTRRAMSKSFVVNHIFLSGANEKVESNGTVLSTNWKEVGHKKVEGSPPDGMEVKKWEY